MKATFRSPLVVLRSVGMSSISTEDAVGEPFGIDLITGLVGGGENLKWLPCTAAAAATAAACSCPWVSVKWWKLVWKALGDCGGIIELLLPKLLMWYGGEESDFEPFELWWSLFPLLLLLLLLMFVSEAGGGCCRSSEMFLMLFSSVGLRRNLRESSKGKLIKPPHLGKQKLSTHW